jgi:hypothetical protein
VEEIGVPGENHRLATSHWQTLSHNGVSSTFNKNFNSKKDSKCNGEKRKDENTNYGHGQQSIEKIKRNEQH